MRRCFIKGNCVEIPSPLVKLVIKRRYPPGAPMVNEHSLERVDVVGGWWWHGEGKETEESASADTASESLPLTVEHEIHEILRRSANEDASALEEVPFQEPPIRGSVAAGRRSITAEEGGGHGGGIFELIKHGEGILAHCIDAFRLAGRDMTVVGAVGRRGLAGDAKDDVLNALVLKVMVVWWCGFTGGEGK